MIIDAFAWVEFALGSRRGETVKECVEKEDTTTLVTTLSELREYSLRTKRDFRSLHAFIRARSRIIGISEEMAIRAGELNHERKRMVKDWGMMDSYVLAASEILGENILTGDAHFRDVKNAILI